MKRFAGPRYIEALLVAVVFAGATWWGTAYWNASLQAGRRPEFYQEYFEPAVMVACHHGFVISHPQPKALEDFLWRRTDAFACAQIPGGADLSTKYLFQGAWRYMLYTVGLTWRITGISWSRMGPLFGVFLGVAIAVAYGIFRLGMGRWLALAGAFALSVSSVHLVNLPHLRDYSKAPFTLALILILGLMATLSIHRTSIIVLSAVYGLVLGVGYGFRTDLLIAIPPILVVLLLFLPGGPRSHLATKAAGAVAFALAFLVTAWPILSFVTEKGGGQWHVALLGLSTPFDDALQIVPAPYDFGSAYADSIIVRTATAYAARVHPEWRNVVFGSHEYDVATGAYLAEIVRRFPGDLVTRAYASTLQIAALPFRWPDEPLAGRMSALYRARRGALTALHRSGPFLVSAAIVVAAGYSLRIGFFLLFVLLYFGGYPAIQFAVRHHFHLEFIGWWAGGFLLYCPRHWRQGSWSVRRGLVFIGVSAVLVLVPWGVLRLYQERQVRGILRDAVNAPTTPIPLGQPDGQGLFAIPGPTAFADVRFMDVELNRWDCGDNPSVTFRYDEKQPDFNYTRTVMLGKPSGPREPTRILAPVYPPAFQGLEFSPATRGCVARVSWVDTDHRPLLLGATLVPGWEREALYQRLPFEPGTGRR